MRWIANIVTLLGVAVAGAQVLPPPELYTTTDLGPCDGPVFMNEVGQVLGTDGGAVWLWSAATGRETLADPTAGDGQDGMFARGINDAGQIVAGAWMPWGTSSGWWEAAWLWDGSAWVELTYCPYRNCNPIRNLGGAYLGGVFGDGTVWGRFGCWCRTSYPYTGEPCNSASGSWLYVYDGTFPQWEPGGWTGACGYWFNPGYNLNAVVANDCGMIAGFGPTSTPGWLEFHTGEAAVELHDPPATWEAALPFACTGSGDVAVQENYAGYHLPSALAVWSAGSYVAEIASPVGEWLRGVDLSEAGELLWQYDALADDPGDPNDPYDDVYASLRITVVQTVYGAPRWVLPIGLPFDNLAACAIDGQGRILARRDGRAYLLTPAGAGGVLPALPQGSLADERVIPG